MSQPASFQLKAVKLPADRTPRTLQSVERSAGAADEDPFIPRGLLKVDQAFDLTPTARSIPGAEADHALTAADGQVMLLELPDGVTVITHPQNLRQTIARIDPDAVDAGGVVDFDRALATRSASMRGIGGAIGDGLGSLVSKVFTLTVDHAADPIVEAAKRKAAEWLGLKGEAAIAGFAELGISWVGTKALMWAIESRLKNDPGLYRWTGGSFGDRIASSATLQTDAAGGPLLVFIHGTGSSTEGSFDALQSASAAYWKPFETRYADRVFAFEHRTLSESPIDNALQLARALPDGATVHLVSHSRGGLVGDLMCLTDFDALIDGYALDNALIAAADETERARIAKELASAYGEQRNTLHELAAELKRKHLRIERYVRVASPARGTRLASGNFDVFLSALLSLMGWVPAFKGNPLYSAFKRVVLEVARNRTNPNLVPGIEAMLPGSPMARFLARATSQPDLQLAIISGDVEGGGWLKRLGVLFTDFTFFDDASNDLVVDTDSMSAGIARGGRARVMFDRGPEINHFRYFVNDETRSALAAWLTERSVDAIEAFKPLPLLDDQPRLPIDGITRSGGETVSLPVVVMLPGIMGSHLWLNRRDRVWFSLLSLAVGGLAKIAMPADGSGDAVEAEALFDRFYGDLQQRLATTHRVVPWPYDWRQPIDVLADRLAETLRAQLDATLNPPQPVRVLAHSMGGLVVRALIHKQPALWDELMSRQNTRFVMLGTPHQGSHLMVETLVGKADTVRKLGVLDQAHDLQSVIDIISGFPGALQLLPKPGFADTGNDKAFDYFDPAVWPAYKKDMHDLWFGNGVGAVPSAAVLERASWLWKQDGLVKPSLPEQHKGKVAYVHGCAAKTPCGIVRQGDRWKMLGTPQGDGSVTWASGAIDGIGARFYMPAEHGALCGTEAYFDSIAELLEHGTGGSLPATAPALRDAGTPLVATYDAGPVAYPSELEIAAGLFGSAPRPRSQSRPIDLLSIRVKAMDLRQATQPIIVGHFEQDAISGAEALIDRWLVHGELTVRHQLGLYAGAIGSASAVLVHGNAAERARGSLRGAVVTGLGKYDGSLTVGGLTEAARTAGLRYLIHRLDSGAAANGTEAAQGVRLASLLLGYNSSANLTIADSVQALMRGVVDANLHFAKTTRSKLRITGLDIVEIYLDTAISAAYAARQIAQTMNADARIDCRIEVDPVLRQGEGMRQRLFDSRGDSYWPRLLITDAAAAEDPGARDSFNGKPRAESDGIAYAERVRFLYLGQRARAEAVVMQRQPGLVERMVERQVMTLAYDADFSRTLFQLLVPHDFKDAARQMQQMVFVVDATTANLPWELMLADDEPLATRTAMVRQLTTTQFRTRVNQTMERRAYVVGNPSTEDFFKHFPDPRVQGVTGLDDLPAAEREAQVVTESLARQGFEVERAIGGDQRAIDVVSRLYRHPYRIVHIAGHGLYDVAAGDGLTRSGVVLSDGLLITAAEIDAMEIVPELVFLNCCHLGKIGRSPIAFNRLAYSIARQLIDIGVRAVVVAGWAVEDAPASLFAETFYERLLSDKLAFGEAVFAARRAAWKRYPSSITWGAYQAYGDPAWRVDPKADRPVASTAAGWVGVAPEELLDRIESERLELQRCGEAISMVDAGRLHERCKQWMKTMPPAWAARADVHGALGDLYGDLGPDYGEHARECYLRALQGSDDDVEVSVRCIEQLAVLESRAGLLTGDAAMVMGAIDRLTRLMQVTEGPLAAAGVNPKRAGLLGSSWKRKAAVHARQYLANAAPLDLRLMGEAITQAAEAYRAVASDAAAKTERPYQTLNWLFLHMLTARPRELASFIPVAQRCASLANQAYLEEPDAWNSTMVADAALAGSLLDGSFDAVGAAGDAVMSAIAAGYQGALDSALVSPKERSAVIQQLELLALFHQARGVATRSAARKAAGQRLDLLARSLAGLPDTPPSPAPAMVISRPKRKPRAKRPA